MEKLSTLSNRQKINYILSGLGAGAFTFFSYWIFKKYFSKRLKNFVKGTEVSQRIAVLSQSEALERSSLIKNLVYTLFIQLKTDSALNVKSIYEGSMLIEFFYTGTEKDSLFIDYIGNIEGLYINNRKVSSFTHENGKLNIDTAQLKLNSVNKVNIKFSSHYENKCYGLRLFIDPEDSVN